MEGTDRAKGGNVKSIFSDFEVTNAAELEAHINMNAIAARANFDKYYAERLTDVSKLWQDQKRRMDVKEPFEVPNFIVDVGVAKFEFEKLPEMFLEKKKSRDDAQKERETAKEAGDIEADIAVSKLVDQSLPLQITFKNCDYTNIDKVVAAIKNCEEMVRINFSNNTLDADDCEALAVLVREHPSVQALDLSGNKLGGEGIEKLVDAFLASKHSIVDLDLGLNELSKSAMKHLSKILQDEKCAIQRLQLAGNKLGIYGAEELVAGLRKNTSMSTLGLQNNNMGNDGLEKLVALFENEESRNENLVQIALEANKADDEILDKLYKYVFENEQIQQLRYLVNLEETERTRRETEIDEEMKLLEELVKKMKEELEETRKKAAQAKAPAPKPAPTKGKGKVPTTSSAKKAPPKPAVAPKQAVSKKEVKAPTAKPKKSNVAGSGVAAAKALSPAKKPNAKKK